MTMDLTDAIRDAIVTKFFEPTTIYGTQQFMDPATGQYSLQTMPIQTEAPALQIARSIWEAKRGEILKAVLEQLDLDALATTVADRVAKDVVAKLTEEPNRGAYSYGTTTKAQREVILERVENLLVQEFGRIAMERLRQTGGLMAVLEPPSAT